MRYRDRSWPTQCETEVVFSPKEVWIMKPFLAVMTEFVMMGEAALNLPELVRHPKILGQEPGRTGVERVGQGALPRAASFLKPAAAVDAFRGHQRTDPNRVQLPKTPGAEAVRRQKK